MAVTIQQIAEKANVSRGTVDRALNNRGRINPEVAERILQIAEEMGYVPRGKKKTIDKKANIKIEDALIACTKNPALKLGIFDKVGSIDISKRADFIVLNDDLSINSVCLRGKFIS